MQRDLHVWAERLQQLHSQNRHKNKAVDAILKAHAACFRRFHDIHLRCILRSSSDKPAQPTFVALAAFLPLFHCLPP